LTFGLLVQGGRTGAGVGGGEGGGVGSYVGGGLMSAGVGGDENGLPETINDPPWVGSGVD
jgi:hypothetical protein